MPKAYGFSDAKTAKALAAMVGGDEYTPTNRKPTAVYFYPCEIKEVISAWNGASFPNKGKAQRVNLNTTGWSNVSSITGNTLPEITVHNLMKIDLEIGMEVIANFQGGKWCIGQGINEVRSLVRFTLNSALTTSDASQTATITNQYGPGVDNTTASGGITVHNLETSSAGTFVFEGNSGDAGLAMWDETTNYRIIQIECPDTTGGGDDGGDGDGGGDGGGGSGGGGGGGSPGGGGTP